MAKGQVTGQAKQNVEADCENSENRNFLQQIGIIGPDGFQNDGKTKHHSSKADKQCDIFQGCFVFA